MKTKWKAFIDSFKPKYSVTVTTYGVVPGRPVYKNSTKHDFGNGAYNEAHDFFTKVIHKTIEVKMAPVEIQLIKGKGRVVKNHTFGPVQEVKNMRMSA